MKQEALFIINSPFQALCAFEAISHYDVIPTFFVFDCEDSKGKTEKLLSLYGYEAIIIPFVGTRELLKRLDKKRKYLAIFVGDYFSYNQYLISVLLAKYNSSLVFLDDGTATLDLLPTVGRRRCNKYCLRAFSYKCLDVLSSIKRVKKTFFSIFDINDYVPYNVEKNTFGLLKAMPNQVPQGIYIIGTNSSVIPFKNDSYPSLLHKLFKYIKEFYPNEKVYYCPHRRDTNDYGGLLEENNTVLFQTDISVEVDFITKGVSPKFIVGFASTALMTLKCLYSNTPVASIQFDVDDVFMESSFRSIEDYYINHCIEIIRL